MNVFFNKLIRNESIINKEQLISYIKSQYDIIMEEHFNNINEIIKSSNQNKNILEINNHFYCKSLFLKNIRLSLFEKTLYNIEQIAQRNYNLSISNNNLIYFKKDEMDFDYLKRNNSNEVRINKEEKINYNLLLDFYKKNLPNILSMEFKIINPNDVNNFFINEIEKSELSLSDTFNLIEQIEISLFNKEWYDILNTYSKNYNLLKYEPRSLTLIKEEVIENKIKELKGNVINESVWYKNIKNILSLENTLKIDFYIPEDLITCNYNIDITKNMSADEKCRYLEFIINNHNKNENDFFRKSGSTYWLKKDISIANFCKEFFVKNYDIFHKNYVIKNSIYYEILLEHYIVEKSKEFKEFKDFENAINESVEYIYHYKIKNEVMEKFYPAIRKLKKFPAQINNISFEHTQDYVEITLKSSCLLNLKKQDIFNTINQFAVEYQNVIDKQSLSRKIKLGDNFSIPNTEQEYIRLSEQCVRQLKLMAEIEENDKNRDEIKNTRSRPKI